MTIVTINLFTKNVFPV